MPPSTEQDSTSSSTATEVYEVRITFMRIQTYLLAVPRLREAVGSNVLLGQRIRRDLTALAEACGATCPAALVPHARFFGSPPCKDPLDEVTNAIDKDNPYNLLTESGVTARDGGHFAALFVDSDRAADFKRRAGFLLRKHLDGLQFEIQQQRLIEDGSTASAAEDLGGKSDSSASAGTEEESQSELARVVQPRDLPIFQVCQAAGTGPAETSYPDPDRPEPVWISSVVEARRDAAKDFFPANWKRGRGVRRDPPLTKDIVGLLCSQFQPQHLAPPQDFKQLAAGGYLAVIHADGNGMGKRGHIYKKREQAKCSGKNPVENALVEERLFYGMRVVVRRAVVAAIARTFGDHGGDDLDAKQPYQVLMLGGDDLLLVCQARYALDFVVNYATELQQYLLADGQPLSIGAGVVLASPNVPFHHLHDLAEGLADSAKRLFRQCTKKTESGDTQDAAHATSAPDNPSVVDWMICSQSWSDDPVSLRRTVAKTSYITRIDAVCAQEELSLTARPYRVLPVQDVDSARNAPRLASLKELREEAGSLRRQGGTARSQLRALKAELEHGRRWSELLYRELPMETQAPLRKVLGDTLWMQTVDVPDEHQGSNRWKTALGDLVEIMEIPRLGGQGG